MDPRDPVIQEMFEIPETERKIEIPIESSSQYTAVETEQAPVIVSQSMRNPKEQISDQYTT